MARPIGTTILAATALVVVVFAGGYGLYPWYDDWMYFTAAGAALSRHAPGEFVWAAFPPHWSPVSFAFWMFNLRLVGWESDVLIRSTVAVLAWLGVIWFASLARRLGASVGAVLAGMATLALHHINAAPFYAFDCYDQVAADLLTWISLGLMITAAGREPARATRRIAWATALVAPALLIKEQALAATAGIVVLAAWSRWVTHEPAALGRARWAAAASAVVLSAAFTAARAAAGLWFEADGPYRFCPGCVPGNVGLLLTSVIVPGRTLDIFHAVREWPPAWSVALPALAATVAVVAALVAGLASSRARDHRRRVGLCAALLLASMFPVVLQENVTELHAHTALFWFALLVTLGTDGWLERVGSRGGARRAVVAVVVVYVAALGVGLQRNLSEMRETGERSRQWRHRLQAALREAPRGGSALVRGLLLVKGDGDYGLYRVTTPGYLLAGTTGLTWQGPNDVRVCAGDDGCGPTDVVVDVGGDGGVRVATGR